MKKIFLFLSVIFLLCTLSGCSHINSANTEDTFESGILKPEHQILFVTENDSYSSDKGYIVEARFIDNEGNYYKLPSNLANLNEFESTDSWYKEVIKIIDNSEPTRKVEDTHLNTIYEFTNNFDSYVDCSMKDYDYTIYDIGTKSLYALYTSPDGTVESMLLCTYGSSTQCVVNDQVREFVNWMIDNDYFIISDNDFRY